MYIYAYGVLSSSRPRTRSGQAGALLPSVRTLCILTFTRYCFTSKLYCGSPSSFFWPPTCKAYPFAILLHDHCAINAPSPTPPSNVIHHTILAMGISCKGQITTRTHPLHLLHVYINTYPFICDLYARRMGQPTQRATNYTARSNIVTAQIFLHANGQRPKRASNRQRSRRRQARGATHRARPPSFQHCQHSLNTFHTHTAASMKRDRRKSLYIYLFTYIDR